MYINGKHKKRKRYRNRRVKRREGARVSQGLPGSCKILRCFDMWSNSVASVLLWIMNCVTLFLFSRRHRLGDFQDLEIICLEAVVTYRKSMNYEEVKSGGHLIRKDKVGSGLRDTPKSIDNIGNPIQYAIPIEQVHQVCKCVPASTQPRKQCRE